MARVIDIDFNANLARFSSQIDKATADLNKFQTNADRMASNVKGIFGGLAAGLSVAAVTAFAKQTLDAADALNDMSQRTQVSVRDLASLRTISEQSGTSLEDVGKAIGKLNLSFSQAQDGTKEQADSLKRLGVTSTDARERFFQLADAYVETGGKGSALADIQKVLGKSYADMIPLLSQGGAGLRAAAEASESFADAMARLAPDADKFNDQLAQMKTNAAGAAAQLLGAVLPSLNEYIGSLQTIIDKGTTLEKIGFFTLGFIPAHILDEQASTAAELGVRIDSYRQHIKELQADGADASKEIAAMNALLERQIKILQAPPKKSPPATTPPTVSTQKSDPLAGLLKSTDIGRMQEFDKTVALLNQRFDYGRKSTELYEQAMTKLVESTFANNFKEAANDAEFMAMVQEDGAKTAAEWAQNLRDLANVDMGRLNDLLKNTDFARLKQDQEDMILLAQAFTEGVKDADGNLRKLSEAEYLDAVKNRLKLVGEEATETKSIFEEMGIVMVSHLEDAISGGKDMSDVLKAMEQDIANLIIRLTIMEPLMKGIKDIFGGTSSGGSSGGGFDLGSIFQTAIDWIFSAKGNVFQSAGLHAYANTVVDNPTVFPFAKGAGIMGEAGPEAIMPLTRMGNGKLGVMAANDGGTSVQVNIINNANGTQATSNERTDQNGNRIIDVMIEQVKGSIASDISQGRGAIPNALSNTYGLNRTAGAY